jgi:hypothetical protein
MHLRSSCGCILVVCFSHREPKTRRHRTRGAAKGDRGGAHQRLGFKLLVAWLGDTAGDCSVAG